MVTFYNTFAWYTEDEKLYQNLLLSLCNVFFPLVVQYKRYKSGEILLFGRLINTEPQKYLDSVMKLNELPT